MQRNRSARPARPFGPFVLLAALTSGACTTSPEQSAAGTWDSASECDTLVGPGSLALYGLRRLALQGDSWDLRTDYYDDAQCTTPTFTVEATGTWAATTESHDADSTRLDADFTVQHVHVTPWIPRLSSYLMMMHCGADDWNMGVTQETTATGCFDYPTLDTCPTKYSLVEVSNGQLRLGAASADGTPACDPSQRPTTLDPQAFVPGD